MTRHGMPSTVEDDLRSRGLLRVAGPHAVHVDDSLGFVSFRFSPARIGERNRGCLFRQLRVQFGQDRGLLLALCGEDGALAVALRGEDGGTLVALGAHLLLHRVDDRRRRVDALAALIATMLDDDEEASEFNDYDGER